MGRHRPLPRAGLADVRRDRAGVHAGRSRPSSPTASDEPCCSARRAIPTGSTRRACSCSPLELEIESATPGTERWVDDLPGGSYGGRLPAAVVSVAEAALRTADGARRPGEVALARVLSDSGTWVVLHGATLVGTGAPRVAVIVEPAHPARITPLLMSAYGLTEREQEVTTLVLQGESTAGIAERWSSRRTPCRSTSRTSSRRPACARRRDLVGKVFFSHYEPRLRDNERRVLEERPLRGGPVAKAVEHP